MRGRVGSAGAVKRALHRPDQPPSPARLDLAGLLMLDGVVDSPNHLAFSVALLAQAHQ